CPVAQRRRPCPSRFLRPACRRPGVFNKKEEGCPPSLTGRNPIIERTVAVVNLISTPHPDADSPEHLRPGAGGPAQRVLWPAGRHNRPNRHSRRGAALPPRKRGGQPEGVPGRR